MANSSRSGCDGSDRATWRAWAIGAMLLASGCTTQALGGLLNLAKTTAATPEPEPVPVRRDPGASGTPVATAPPGLTPAPEVTPTGEVSPTPTAAQSAEVSASATPTATPDAASSETPAPSPSPSPTPTPTPTATPTPTPSPSPTPSPTATPRYMPEPDPNATPVPYLDLRDADVGGNWYMCGYENDWIDVDSTTGNYKIVLYVGGTQVADGGWFTADAMGSGAYINFAYYPADGNAWFTSFGSINYYIHGDSLWRKSDTTRGPAYLTRFPVAGASRCLTPEE